MGGYNYGVSYLGGKCTLASQIFAQFPAGFDTFVDPFAGGMSMSHYAALQGFSRVIANDLDGKAMSIFREYISGAPPMRGFVGRYQFNRYKGGTSRFCAIMRMIYGFSGNCYSYMYCKAREMYSQAVNDALFFCDFQPLRMIFGERIASAMCDFCAGFDAELPLRERHRAFIHKIAEFTDFSMKAAGIDEKKRTSPIDAYRVNHIERIVRLENLARDKDACSRIEYHCTDYRCIDIPSHSLIYCDPPYFGRVSYGYAGDFNRADFLDWAEMQAKRGNAVFISEYEIDDPRFVCVWSKEKKTRMGNENSGHEVERLFTWRGSVGTTGGLAGVR